jgi:hypothetical protein
MDMATPDALLTAVHYHPHHPGAVFKKDSRPALQQDTPLDAAKIMTPNVVATQGGAYRMYYTGVARQSAAGTGVTGPHILSAVSGDCDVWVKEPGIRVGNGVCAAVADRALCPDVIPLSDGRLRMYFEAGRRDGPSVILSAVSDDGLAFQLEPGERTDPRFVRTYTWGAPRVLHINEPPFRFRMYYHRYTHPLVAGLDAGNHIISAVSSDGLDFVQEDGVRISQEDVQRESFSVYAPDVIRLGTGGYCMYYSAWGAGTEGGSGGWNDRGGVAGGIFIALSDDGLGWCKVRTADGKLQCCVDLATDDAGAMDSGLVSEPCVSILPDGRTRLWYECCNRAYHRPAEATLSNNARMDSEERFSILSATTPFKATAGAAL